MPEKEKKDRINPQTTNIEIGTRSLRTIKVYPVSFGDQLELTDLITSTIQEFYKSREEIENKDDTAMVEFLIGLLRENLARIIKLITDEEETVFKEMTNNQVVELAKLIYEMNYAESLKNAQSLFEKIQQLFQLKRQ